MIIDCISDLHGYRPKLEGGDLLIVAGDLTARDMPLEHGRYCQWQYDLPYEKIIFIAGNHDGHIQKRPDLYIDGCDSMSKIIYLQDSEITYKGMKIWGSPWTPTFYNWHFMKDRGREIERMWNMIPDDTEILITHGPPFGIQDQVKDGEPCLGCEELKLALNRLKKLKLHVFGHIHGGYGKMVANGVTFVNASIMTEDYKPLNKPIRVEL